ncbi:MAG: hypothetical protein LRY76_08025 [Alphaproteobacteria bacterium]|nr:hypothetical protein [Alphaproteobacteria bacterium]MCD8525826.1 hypothetical protein [Alphaproteobacteria bacterium]MCD8571446.1 hypothetical protein [Alphaproteobacteria bacterium]
MLSSLSRMQKDLARYALLVLVVAGYFGWLSWHYGLTSGGIVAALTWSFFVLCTPVADAGFLLDFPVRLLTGMRMVFTEMIVWVLAFTINGVAMIYNPDSYQKTALTRLFYEILTQPWPYWSIIVLCCIGTFLSVIFGDEIFDAASNRYAAKQSKWLHLGGAALLMGLIVLIYYDLVQTLGIEKIIQGR